MTDPSAPVRHRVRFRYAKLGKVRFTSHRDVARMWERALRRSGLPVSWSEGFSPRPLLSFGLALPTGAESVAEYVDVALDGPSPGATPGELPGAVSSELPGAVSSELPGAMPSTDPEREGHPSSVPGAGALPEGGAVLVRRLSQLLPDGIDVLAMGLVPDGAGSLQQEVSSCSWDVEVQGLAAEELATRIDALLAADHLVVQRERKGRLVEDDVRPAVLALDLLAPERLRAELATRPRGLRPQELLCGLGPDVTLVRACRRHQWIERDGTRCEPLAIGSEIAEACAS